MRTKSGLLTELGKGHDDRLFPRPVVQSTSWHARLELGRSINEYFEIPWSTNARKCDRSRRRSEHSSARPAEAEHLSPARFRSFGRLTIAGHTRMQGCRARDALRRAPWSPVIVAIRDRGSTDQYRLAGARIPWSVARESIQGRPNASPFHAIFRRWRLTNKCETVKNAASISGPCLHGVCGYHSLGTKCGS
jgi:hypothetical protein